MLQRFLGHGKRPESVKVREHGGDALGCVLCHFSPEVGIKCGGRNVDGAFVQHSADVESSSAHVNDANATFAVVVEESMRQWCRSPVARQQRRVAVDGTMMERRDETSRNKKPKRHDNTDVPPTVWGGGTGGHRRVAHAFAVHRMEHLQIVRLCVMGTKEI